MSFILSWITRIVEAVLTQVYVGRFFKVSKHNTKYEWWSGTEGGFGEVYIKHTYINMTCLLLTYSIQSKAKMEHYSKPFLIYSYKNEKS